MNSSMKKKINFFFILVLKKLKYINSYVSIYILKIIINESVIDKRYIYTNMSCF